MLRPKKQVEDETPEEEVVSEVPGGDDGLEASADISLPDDDLIGEPESCEPEQADSLGLEDNAAGSVASDSGEDTSQLPEKFMTMATAPRSGIRVMLFTPAGEYIRAFCKRSRRFIDRRWQISEKWCDAVTGRDVEFEPLGWRSLVIGE